MQRSEVPRIDAIGFANVLDKNPPLVQASDVERVFREAEEQVDSSAVAVFACELLEQTKELLERRGYSGHMYVQNSVKRVGQVILSNRGEPPLETKHHILAKKAWVGRQSGPAAVTTSVVRLGDTEQTVAGTHLTHLTGNPVAQFFEASELLRVLEREAVGLLVTDSNRGLISRNGAPLADACQDHYFRGRPVLKMMRAVTLGIEQRYVPHLWSRLNKAGFVQSDETKTATTWVPDPTKDEGLLDKLSARHGLTFSTDHVVTRGSAEIAVRLLSEIARNTDHVPMIASIRP